jgi:hypothetical protein
VHTQTDHRFARVAPTSAIFPFAPSPAAAMLPILGAVLAWATAAAGQTQVFTDQSAFLSQTGAAAEPPIPNVGLVGRTGATYTLGHITFAVSTTDPEVTLILQDATTINPGNEVLMSSVENLDVQLDQTFGAIGFFFVEGTGPEFCTSQCPCLDATFQVTLFRQGVQVGSFSFNAPDDVLSFYGVRSCAAFDRVQFRDTSNGCDNEMWGRFFLAPPVCRIDMNCDGRLDVQDFLTYLALFAAADPRADVNADGGINVGDFLAFLGLFAAGC